MKGIYFCKCEPTEKVYVGQTVDFPRRKAAHLSELRRGAHRNLYLQAAFDKYGEDAFTWEFIECDQENLMEMEQYFIDNSDKKTLFNMDWHVRTTPAGKERSKEHCESISKAKKGIPNPLTAGELNGSKRPEVRRVLADKKKKLSNEQCLEVSRRYKLGLTQDTIASQLGCTRRSVCTALAYTKKYLLPEYQVN